MVQIIGNTNNSHHPTVQYDSQYCQYCQYRLGGGKGVHSHTKQVSRLIAIIGNTNNSHHTTAQYYPQHSSISLFPVFCIVRKHYPYMAVIDLMIVIPGMIIIIIIHYIS